MINDVSASLNIFNSAIQAYFFGLGFDAFDFSTPLATFNGGKQCLALG